MMRRRLLYITDQGGLPADYIAVQYLESTGTQYIDTGWIPNLDTEWYVDFSNLVPQGGSYIGPGGYSGTGTFCTIGVNNTQPTRIYTSFGNKNDIYYIRSVSIFTERVQLSISKTGVIDNNTEEIRYNAVTFGTARFSIGLFARIDSSGSVARYVSMRLYECIIREAGSEVRHMIPCIRISDSKPGLYDLVGRQFYTNQGTGEFITP